MVQLETFATAQEPLKRNISRDRRLCRYLQQEITEALSAKLEYDYTILEALRQYDGVPKRPFRTVPFEDAPNIEITLGAIAVDALYAQCINTLFAVSPVLTVNPTARAASQPDLVEVADICQVFANWGQENEWGLRKALEHAGMDHIQLGTCAIYAPYINITRKTRVRKIIDRGPRIMAIPIEDLIVPGGSVQDANDLPWIAIRHYMSASEVRAYVTRPDDDPLRWELDRKTLAPFKLGGSISDIRMQREAMSRTRSNARLRNLYEVYEIEIRFDYDRDGEEEELLVFWDRTANAVAWVGYSPYDYRAIEKEVYQVRAHCWQGLGVMEMLRPYEEEITVEHNERAINVKLANMRLYGGKNGVIDEGTLTAYANRIIPMNNPREDLVSIPMGDVYPSSQMYEQMTLSLAERRVGLSELSVPKPSQVIGSRTPAFTTASLMQRENTRFAPAFDNFRRLAANAVKQCLWRYHERLLMEDRDGPAAINIRKVLGDERGEKLIRLLKNDDFLTNVAVEMTASSASVNRDSDRQNAMLLVQILTQYYQRSLELVMLASNPQTPQPVRDTATKIADAATAIVERTIRTFDQIRDPDRFLIDSAAEIDQAAGAQPPSAMLQIGQMLGLLGGSGAGPPAPLATNGA